MSRSGLLPINFHSTPIDAGKRLDQFLVSKMPEVSRARLQQLISQGKVLVDQVRSKSSLRLRGDEVITVTGPVAAAPLRAVAEEIPLNILYEDDDLAVINKPAGMMVHAGAGATEDERNRGTVVNALLGHFGALSQVGGELRPGIVHRLDRATSGLMVVAKNDLAHRRLSEQFAHRQVKKRYIGLVHGWMKDDQGTISSSISRDRIRRIRMTTRRSGGREAVTHYQVRERIDSIFGKFSLLELRIDTGRTHQIRVHLAALGHPIVGDTLYGAPREIKKREKRKNTLKESSDLSAISLPRNFLHASALEFDHPRTTVQIKLSSNVPKELEHFMLQLQQPEQ